MDVILVSACDATAANTSPAAKHRKRASLPGAKDADIAEEDIATANIGACAAATTRPSRAWVPDATQYESEDTGEEPTYTLPRELQTGKEEESFDSDSDDDNTHIGQWRDADTGALALAINYHRSHIKGSFVGSGGGVERRKEAWKKVAGE